MATPLTTVHINHQWTSIDKAKVSILDRGFLFGDAVYESISFYQGQPFLANEHLDRLDNSLEQIKLPNPLTRKEWLTLLDKTLEVNHISKEDGYYYIQVTRGCDETRLHAWKNNAPTFLMMSFLKPMPATLLNINTISQPDLRWGRCDIKSTSLLANILANNAAHENNASECLFFQDNLLTEGSSSNIFIIKNEIVYTPQSTQNILLGITREYIFNICQKLNIKHQEKTMTKEDVLNADEVFISSTTRIIQSVSKLDEHHFPNNTPLTKKLFDQFTHQILNPFVIPSS
ncbi:MAG TPA: aminotransferase class IV [Gammaproteobacteria bacterium]|nr:aminotransferase class IV [Gammaproteobacteria bacterium]